MKPRSGPRTKRVTAEDVAKMAGSSRSAVSRAFTPGAYLNAEKRKAILKAAEELGYRPNALAASLQAGGSNLVAIFVGEMPNEYDQEVLKHLTTGLCGAGRWPIVIGGSEETAREAVSNVLRYPLEAIILRSGSLNEDIVESCGKLSIPVISSGRMLDAPGVDNVSCRNSDGMRRGTIALLGRGRTRFAYIGGPGQFSSSHWRREGLCQALSSQNLSLIAEETGDFTVQSGYDAAARLVQRGEIDALVCANDAMAIGALTALREKGICVPEDISVLGFDDIAMAAWPSFSLTTLRNPIPELVAEVVGLLDRRAESPDKPEEQLWLEPELILRSSH
ncbi:LacI family DNA-binding transcriptional regulator [Ruegeria sp.]|uniref:LacI family DNA-binding transcriptional regulator n=1 Tax=Ruegeria sp. TaxID=1879320 RepID=UPI003C7E1B13